MEGKRVLHYKIRGKIGSGGMGEVYLAYDERLDREVALKFLPASLKHDTEARERLLREARSASKLIHSNIVAIHAIEEADGHDFIVMEYVEGETLDRLLSAGEIAPERVLEIGRRIAEALAAANEKGIVHRDLKPANIIITPAGQPKILDFGLATFTGATELTEEGSTMGTMAYMSPEQTSGRRVDHRSDLFSFGVLLYEMIAGRKPFGGEHRAAVVYSIVHDAHQPLARYRSDVPGELQRIVDKLLRKKPDERYQSAADLVADLRALGRESTSARQPVSPAPARAKSRVTPVLGAVAVLVVVAVVFVMMRGRFGNTPRVAPRGDGRIMLAVLPFENLGDAGDDYFADGITEEITARLATVDGLGVIARTSVLAYRNTDKDVRRIGQELGVDYLLEGTVRWQRAGDVTSRVRVTPQLIRVADATHVWAEVYDEPMTAVFDVQTSIARGVVRGLDVTFRQPDDEPSGVAPTQNMAAYDYYLRGMAYYNAAKSERATRIALQMFEKAVELDPDYAVAYARTSQCHSDMYWFHYDRSKERLALAWSAADRALTLAPTLAESHQALGWYYYHGRSEYEKALAEFDLVLERRPNDAEVHAAIAFVKRRQGDWEGTVASLRRALELNPRAVTELQSLGETLSYMRDYESARRYLEAAERIDPGSFWPALFAGYSYINEGDIRRARECNTEALRRLDDLRLKYQAIYFDMIASDYDSALRRLDDINEPDDNQFDFRSRPMLRAFVYRRLGRDDDMRAQLAIARDGLKTRIEASPRDPRYHGALGLVYAALGEKEPALAEGRLAVELQDEQFDAMKIPVRDYEFAQIHALNGDAAQAVVELEKVLDVPSFYSKRSLQLDPFWDPIRDYPNFRRLVGESS